MNRRADGSRRWRIGVLASIACLGSVLALVAGQGSAGATPNKPFGVVICAPGPMSITAAFQSCPPGSPPVVAPGVTTMTGAPVTAVITDETATGTGLQIGSVNLTAPSGVTVVSASLPPPVPPIAACTPTTAATTSCFTGSVLELRGLSVPPGGSLDVSLGIDTPPPPSNCTTNTPCAWGATAKQSNDYNGPPGNQLNLDSGSSQLGIVLSSEATCTSAKKANSCSTTLADGGATGSPGAVSITTSATGTSGGIFYQSIDFGPHLDAASECSGIDSMHDEYINGAALNGPNARSFHVTIVTTDYPGYQAEVCVTTSKQFMTLVPGSTTLGQAASVTQPDGTPGFAGLLPDCKPGTVPTVNCTTEPGVVSRSTSTSADGTLLHTTVISFPAGFDATVRQ